MVAARVEARRYTAEEYLAIERAAEIKSEYIDGNIVAMSGATREHDRIKNDATTALNIQLMGKPCETFTSDVRVKSLKTGRYTYPDVSVVCGEPVFEDDTLDTLLNPAVIIEVLSPSTEAYDRGDKFAAYRLLPSLREYLLIAQDRVSVEHYLRRDDGWLLTAFTSLDDAVPLPTLSCTLPVHEVYRRVTFAEPSPTMQANDGAPPPAGAQP